ncbi:MAG: ExeA family protein [Planctomycetota bacterium]
MYETHWGLQESPFRGQTDARHFYCSPSHEEALARLEFLIENRRRLGLVVGLPGSGKTMLLKVLARRLSTHGGPVAMVNLLSLDAYTMLWELATQLGCHPPRRQASFQLWQSITDCMTANRYQRLSTVILLDDVDEATPEVLTHLVRLVRHEPSAESSLTIVLAADSRAETCLGRRILELVELRSELECWAPDDTISYLRGSLQRAGTTRPVFAEDAASRLHELTRGVPRQVSNLAEMALVAGAGRHLEQIDADTVESAYNELVLGH